MNFLKNLISNFKKNPQTSLGTTCNIDQNNIDQNVDKIEPNFEDLKDYLTSQSSDTIPDVLDDVTEPTDIEINTVNDINIDSETALVSNNNDTAEDNENQETMIDLNELGEIFNNVDYSEEINELDIELGSLFDEIENTKEKIDDTAINFDLQATFETFDSVSNDQNIGKATETDKTGLSSINELNQLTNGFINTEISTTARTDDEVVINNNANRNVSDGFTWTFDDFQDVFQSFIASTVKDTVNYTFNKNNRSKTAKDLLEEHTINKNSDVTSITNDAMVTVRPIVSSSLKHVEMQQNNYINLLSDTTESVNRQNIVHANVIAETIANVDIQDETKLTQANQNNDTESKLNKDSQRKGQNIVVNNIKQIGVVENTSGDIDQNSRENDQNVNFKNQAIERDSKSYISISSSDEMNGQDIAHNEIDDLKGDTISISSTEDIKLDSDDCDGYLSSDFEFISESEADVGIIINTTKKEDNNRKTQAIAKVSSNILKQTENLDNQPGTSNVNRNFGSNNNFEYIHNKTEEDKNNFKIPRRVDKFYNQPGPSGRYSTDNKNFEFSNYTTEADFRIDSNILKQEATDDQPGPSSISNRMCNSNNNFEQMNDTTEDKAKSDINISKQTNTNQSGPSNINTRNINYDYSHAIFNEPDYRPNHTVPEGDAYLNLFRGYHAPASIGNLNLMENKSVRGRTYMNIESNGMGFDVRLHETLEESDELQEEAEETVRKILINYPTQNRKRRRRF